eukprot:snap_masked-scaffold_15-processed-gene-7.24-mRNA-1 protein AED:1.00 eAED:1.00 QI:0/-1/0/0/-1/1/1/0/252
MVLKNFWLLYSRVSGFVSQAKERLVKDKRRSRKKRKIVVADGGSQLEGDKALRRAQNTLKRLKTKKEKTAQEKRTDEINTAVKTLDRRKKSLTRKGSNVSMSSARRLSVGRRKMSTLNRSKRKSLKRNSYRASAKREGNVLKFAGKQNLDDQQWNYKGTLERKKKKLVGHDTLELRSLGSMSQSEFDYDFGEFEAAPPPPPMFDTDIIQFDVMSFISDRTESVCSGFDIPPPSALSVCSEQEVLDFPPSVPN